MHFANIHILHWLWGIILLAAFFYWAGQHHRNIMQRFSGAFTSALAENFSEKRQISKYILLTGVFLFSIFALARPQWGFEWQEVRRQGLDILVAVDVSKSMLTEDVRPNRLARTKLAVKDLVKKLTGDRIGLIAFAGDAFTVCPLTVDYNGFLLALNDLDSSTISRGGTSIAQAVQEALKSYDRIPSKYKVLIIITDGESLEGDPLAAAREAKEKGIKVFCIGIGTREGELIRIQNSSGEYEFLKDRDGNFVKSRLNEDLLQKIALTTGGAYARAGGAQFGLELIYDRELADIEKREIKSKMEKKYNERFQVPLALAFLLLILETAISTRRSP